MGFIESLVVVSSATGLYDFIKDKLCNDYEEFCNQVKKTIISVCNELRQSLEEGKSQEFKLPECTTDVIYYEVMECIKHNQPIDELVLQNKLDIPNHLYKGLMQIIIFSLNESFEFCMREYVA